MLNKKLKRKQIKVGNINIGNGTPVVLIAGTCVIESLESAMYHATKLKELAEKYNVPFIYKSSYDKANRSSINSFRGLGIDKGLEILKHIKKVLNIPILTDVHEVKDVKKVAEVADIIQIPAFLCRQTDLLVAVGKTNKPVNIKKGQFISPNEIINIIKKIEYSGNTNILLTERGTTFGYNNLVNDFRGIIEMQKTGYPVIYDATHSMQKPGSMGNFSGGTPEYILPLSKCALALGCDALFIEVHQNPDEALCDGKNSLALKDVEKYLKQIKKMEQVRD